MVLACLFSRGKRNRSQELSMKGGAMMCTLEKTGKHVKSTFGEKEEEWSWETWTGSLAQLAAGSPTFGLKQVSKDGWFPSSSEAGVRWTERWFFPGTGSCR